MKIVDNVKIKTTTYTDNELLFALKQFYSENKRNPTQQDFIKNDKYPNYGTYHIRFGSWTNALKLAGLINDSDIKKIERTNKGGRKNVGDRKIKKYTETQLISLLKQYHNEYNKVPSSIDFSKNPNYPSPETYRNHFRSWINALKLAGFDVDNVITKRKDPISCHEEGLVNLSVSSSSKDRNEAIDLSELNCNGVLVDISKCNLDFLKNLRKKI